MASCKKSASSDFSLKGGKKTPPLTPFQTAVRDEQVQHQRDCRGGALAANVLFHKKETNVWCWAASGEMVTEFVDPPNKVRQCTQAQDLCGAACASVNCCAATTPQACVITGMPTIDRHGFLVTPHPHPLEPLEIVEELGCNRRPFIYEWSALGGGGHQMVAVDFVTRNGRDYILTHDPDGYRSFPTAYRAYREGYGTNGTDLVQIRKGS